VFDSAIPEETAWWAEDCENPGPALWGHCRAIENKQFHHHQRLLFNALQYGNREITGFDWGWGNQRHTSLTPDSEGIDSVVVSVVEALIAEVGKTKVKARPKTKKASFKLRRASRKLDRYLYAEAKRIDFWEKCKQGFEDSAWAEVGALYWGWESKGDDAGVYAERVFPDELIVNNDECYSEPNPVSVQRRRCLHIDEVLAAFGSRLTKDQIGQLKVEANRSVDSGWIAQRGPGPGFLVVVEGHRRPVGATPGRHVIGTSTLTILDEPWNEDWFPYTFFHFSKPVSGFYCKSAVERAWPWQKRLNKLNAAIEDAQDLACRMRIWAPTGGKIDIKELTNRMGKVIHSAIEPKTLNWQTNVAELYEERRRCKEECFADFGLTQMAAQGKLPPGTRLDSARAINEYAEMPANRLVDLAQRYERFQLAGYDMMVRISELAHAQGKKLKTTWVAGKRVEEIEWDDIDYSRDRYVLQVEPSSTFNETLAAHTDDMDKLVQAGIITPEEYLSQRATPDTEKLISLRIAGTENLFHSIEQIESGKYVPPSPLQDLVSGVQLFHFHYLDLPSEYDDVPESVLNNLQLWVMQAKWILEMGANFSSQGSEVASQGMAPGPGMPPGPGGGAMPTAVDPAMMMQMGGQVPGMGPAAAPTTPSLVPNAGQLG
jgi:hypothetical protein